MMKDALVRALPGHRWRQRLIVVVLALATTTGVLVAVDAPANAYTVHISKRKFDWTPKGQDFTVRAMVKVTQRKYPSANDDCFVRYNIDFSFPKVPTKAKREQLVAELTGVLAKYSFKGQYEAKVTGNSIEYQNTYKWFDGDVCPDYTHNRYHKRRLETLIGTDWLNMVTAKAIIIGAMTANAFQMITYRSSVEAYFDSHPTQKVLWAAFAGCVGGAAGAWYYNSQAESDRQTTYKNVLTACLGYGATDALGALFTVTKPMVRDLLNMGRDTTATVVEQTAGNDGTLEMVPRSDVAQITDYIETTWAMFRNWAEPQQMAISPVNTARSASLVTTYVRGPNDALYRNSYDDGTWTGYGALDGPIAGKFVGKPAVVRQANGDQIVFVRGADNHLWQRNVFAGGGSSAWYDHGGVLSDSPAATQDPETGRITVYVRSSDDRLYAKSWSGTAWGAFVPIGTPDARGVRGAPSAYTASADYDHLVVRDPDGAVWMAQIDRAGTHVVGWWNLGGSTQGSPSANQNSARDRISVYVRGTDNGLWVKTYDTYRNIWSSWRSLGGNFQQAPASVAASNGCDHVFVRGLDNQMMRNIVCDGEQSGWSAVGGSLNDSPAAVSWPRSSEAIAGTSNGSDAESEANVASTYFRGENGDLKTMRWADGAWGTMTSLGGPTNGKFLGTPSVVRNEAGWRYVFVRGTDNALYQLTLNPDGSPAGGWYNHGGGLTESPAAVQDPVYDRISVYVRGGNGSLYAKTWDGSSWSGFRSLGGQFQGAPAAVADANEWDAVFVRGTDNTLMQLNVGPSSTTNWYVHGGTISDSPAASRSSDGQKISVYVRGGNASLYVKSFNRKTSSWSAFQPLGAQLIGSPAAAPADDGCDFVFVRATNSSLAANTFCGTTGSGWQGGGNIGTSSPSAISW